MSTPTRLEQSDHIRAADELTCINAMNVVAEELRDDIIKRPLSLGAKEHFCGFVKQLRQALQRAMIDGGRKMFEDEAQKWTGSVLYKDFMRRLDHMVTRMPTPRRREHRVEIAPRGTGVYFPRGRD
jgi:hypothetical protein